MVTELAITVVGRDRPGIIADVSAILAGIGFNLTDSTMTLLRGHFAMTLICVGQVNEPEVEAALQPLTSDGGLLTMVRNVPPEPSGAEAGVHPGSPGAYETQPDAPTHSTES